MPPYVIRYNTLGSLYKFAQMPKKAIPALKEITLEDAVATDTSAN